MAFFKKQTTAIALMLLTALPVFISVNMFVRQSIIQEQREERFNQEQLQTITISSAEIIWLKAGKEILHDGKLFDVKSFRSNGTYLELTGFYDQKEDKFVKEIKGFFQQKEDSGSKADYLVVKFLFSPKYNEVITFTIENNWQLFKRQFPVYAEINLEASYPTAAPPPKAC